MNELTDEEIIAGLTSGGDPQKFGLLYDRYSNKVYRKCISFTDDSAIAKDLAHDIFLKVFLKLSNFKGKSKFSTWLYSITYNHCVDFVKKRDKIKTVDVKEEHVISESLDDVNEQFLLELKVERLKVVLEEIKVESKMLLLMKYQDELSIADMMEVTGKKESAIKMSIKRAKMEAVKMYKAKYGNDTVYI